MKITLFLAMALCCTITTKLTAQNMYACFEHDKDTSLKISVFFDKNVRAKYVLYRGQKRTITITFVKRGREDKFWFDEYLEKVKGKTTGTYTFTNAGTHNLDVTYKRKRDGKEFYFMIIEGSMDADNNCYRSTPCFQ